MATNLYPALRRGDVSAIGRTIAGAADAAAVRTAVGVYSTDEVDAAIADLDTALQPDDLTGYALESYVDTQVAALVAAAPATLDTLNELAAALGGDADFAATTAEAIGLKANTADFGTAAFTAASAYATAAQGTNADTAHGWGDHAAEGYIKSYTVTQGDVTAHQAALSITISQITDNGDILIEEPVVVVLTASGVDAEAALSLYSQTLTEAFDLLSVSGQCKTSDPPTGSAAVIDVNKDGTSIFSTPLTIDSGESDSSTAATPSVLSTSPTPFAVGDVISIDLDQVGATNPGKEYKALLHIRRTLRA